MELQEANPETQSKHSQDAAENPNEQDQGKAEDNDQPQQEAAEKGEDENQNVSHSDYLEGGGAEVFSTFKH